MALTKEDIESAIAQTENQDVIRHSLSNYFEGLNEPVAVAIGIGKYREDRDMHPENVDKVVNLLRSKGIDAVSFMDPKAAHSDKFVVNESGVLCPFMSPEDSLKAATLIGDAVINEGHQIVGHINPQVKENILYTADSSIKIKNDGISMAPGINLELSHPNTELFGEIEQRNGGDYKSFIDKKINEAYAEAVAVDFNSLDTENVYQNGMAELYRGGTLGANPYATVSEWNSRKVAHSSPAISICAGFSGKGRTMSSRGGAVYEKTQSGLEYGFIYKLESMGDEQVFYHNVGLETGDNPRSSKEVDLSVDTPWNGHNGQIYESPILPHHNKLKAMYIYVGKPNETEAKLYSIPLDENGNIADKEWQDFMSLHEPSDDKVMGYLKDRQDAQKKEQETDSKHTYQFELKQNLDTDNQDYLETVTPKDFLRNFIHDSEIQEDGNTLLLDKLSDANSKHSGIFIERLKLKSLPDLSSVKINGHFSLNSNTISEVDASKLPECTQGISMIGVDVKNVSALSADKFLNIIGATTDKEGFIHCDTATHNYFSGDGMPQDFDKLKFMQLPSGVNLVYDSIDNVPETLQGIGMSGVTIKDQSSIEKMSAADFIYKMNGNLGTHPMGFDVSVMYSEGIRHTEIHDNIVMNLENTNIGTFPENMKDLTLRRIILNHETVVTSLDNFPTTKEGVFDLNFQGDLKNETMESFLLKTKGTEWVKGNTSKAADGHLIINCDFDFKTNAWGDRNRPKMNITSLPKDIIDVEFKGKIEPSELSYRLNSYIQTLKDKDNNNLRLTSNTNLKMDLSQHQATEIDIQGKTQEIILPQNIKSVRISDSENFQISALKNAPQNLDLSFHNLQNEEPLDMGELSINRLSFYKTSAGEINFPKQAEQVDFQETKLTKPINIAANVKEFTAYSTNFPNGSVLDLSECKKVSLINCSLPENTTIDLSKCERVDLSDVDLSKVNVILPTKGMVLINENVKFAPDYKLDLSQNKEGYVHHSVACAEVKLPQKIFNDNINGYTIPTQAKEISTTCIANSYCKFNIPQHTKIIDKRDNTTGKNVPLKFLEAKGVSKEQISALRKERFKQMLGISRSHSAVAPVVQDLAAMAKETGTLGFSYDGIHNSSINNAMHYDYKKVINGVAKAQEILPMEAEKKLLKCGALTPLPNGEYLVNVGYSTRTGGGRNISGDVFFTFSKDDVHSQYHEMAHSYQKKENLFDDGKIDKLYNASEKGLQPDERKEDKLVNKETYKDYLKETHSEIFAQTALMLREESYLGFVNQALYAQDYGTIRNAEGLLSGAILDKGSADKAKLYACQPAMDAAIKEVAAIRKSGKRNEYFNPDGTLNAQKVSKLCEKITLDNVYSPRTYKAFLDNNFNDSHTTGENDWKKGSILATAKYLPAKISMGIQNIGKNIRKRISIAKHAWLRRNERSALQKMTAQRRMSDNPQIQATNDYAYIQAKMLLVAKSSKYQNADDVIDMKLIEMNKNNMTIVDLQKMTEDIKAPKALKNLKEVASIIAENNDNPYFQAIMKNPENFADMRYGKSKIFDKSNEDNSAEISLSEKEKIAALSGRTGTKPNQTSLSDETPKPTPEKQSDIPSLSVANLEAQSSQIDVSDMNSKEKIAALSGRSGAPSKHYYSLPSTGKKNTQTQTTSAIMPHSR